MLASKETTNRFTNWVKVQQLFPLSNRVPHSNTKEIGLFWKKSPKQRGNKAPGCTHQSHLPYCMKPLGSQVSILRSNCQALEEPVPLWGILKRRSLEQVVPAAARAQLGLASHKQQGSWLAGPKCVTESKLVLLASRQANKRSDEL